MKKESRTSFRVLIFLVLFILTLFVGYKRETQFNTGDGTYRSVHFFILIPIISTKPRESNFSRWLRVNPEEGSWLIVGRGPIQKGIYLSNYLRFHNSFPIITDGYEIEVNQAVFARCAMRHLEEYGDFRATLEIARQFNEATLGEGMDSDKDEIREYWKDSS